MLVTNDFFCMFSYNHTPGHCQESASHTSLLCRDAICRFFGPRDRLRAQGSALTRNDQFHMARRTCFREQYYTGTRRYNTGREDCRPRPAETIYGNLMVFHQYLWIAEFVWAELVCGTRKYQSASVDRSGVIQKIHMRKRACWILWQIS